MQLRNLPSTINKYICTGSYVLIVVLVVFAFGVVKRMKMHRFAGFLCHQFHAICTTSKEAWRFISNLTSGETHAKCGTSFEEPKKAFVDVLVELSTPPKMKMQTVDIIDDCNGKCQGKDSYE